MSYYNKYLKYKNKYINLQYGGMNYVNTLGKIIYNIGMGNGLQKNFKVKN